MGKKTDFNLNRSFCKSCGICVALCPVHALSKDEDGKPVMESEESCTGCKQCEYRCPDFAIRMGGNDDER
ncbi:MULTISPECIES: 4Fe-4S binding protein [unclassified Clostridium]|uniref:4Fe-4S dicluster domain-containing protein n=1 Tax=unclassified Clostridium TaxID=2614128 RepID=UPI001106B052|nr:MULTISPECIES: 4Fe-4S binding protein [unclassified Clostridium]